MRQCLKTASARQWMIVKYTVLPFGTVCNKVLVWVKQHRLFGDFGGFFFLQQPHYSLCNRTENVVSKDNLLFPFCIQYQTTIFSINGFGSILYQSPTLCQLQLCCIMGIGVNFLSKRQFSGKSIMVTETTIYILFDIGSVRGT